MKNGFTLVEMLVALFIFALLTSGGVAMMRFTMDNQAVVREHTDRTAQFQATRAILKADLSQAAPRRIRTADGRALRGAFGGGEAEAPVLLRLARRGWENPDGAARASVQYVEYRLVDRKLERTAAPALDGTRMGQPQVLIDRVSRASVSFLWQGQWIPNLPGGPADPLPQAVRLDLEIDGVGAVSQLFLVTGEAA